MKKERKKFLIIEKLNEVIKEILNENIFFTVLDVSLPQKGGIMKVKMSIFPDEKAKDVIGVLNKEQNKIKNKIKEKIYLRYLPQKIKFIYTPTLKEMQDIDEILKKMS